MRWNAMNLLLLWKSAMFVVQSNIYHKLPLVKKNKKKNTKSRENSLGTNV